MPPILTVITPATAAQRRLCAVEAVRAELLIDGVDQDYLLLPLIDAASQQVAGYCRRVLALETVRETWRLTERPECLLLRRHPVTAITSVIEDGVTLAGTDYDLDADAGFIWRLDGETRIGWAQATVQVTYSAGYVGPGQSSPTLPYDIQRATVLLVSMAYNSRGRDASLRSVNLQGVVAESYQMPTPGSGGMPTAIADMLAPYREWAA
jgi:uncharacterized phiE125 gp8 family phage protein